MALPGSRLEPEHTSTLPSPQKFLYSQTTSMMHALCTHWFLVFETKRPGVPWKDDNEVRNYSSQTFSPLDVQTNNKLFYLSTEYKSCLSLQ